MREYQPAHSGDHYIDRTLITDFFGGVTQVDQTQEKPFLTQVRRRHFLHSGAKYLRYKGLGLSISYRSTCRLGGIILEINDAAS